MDHNHMEKQGAVCCDPSAHGRRRPDILLWGSLTVVVLAYLAYLLLPQVKDVIYLNTFTLSSFELLNQMSWGLVIGILFVGILDKIPQTLIQKIMGRAGSFSGIIRATLAGVLLDLCSHGILLVGLKLYKQGLSLGQTMAFLIASPWNSLSLTLILWALVGFKWMITFLLLSMAMAIISGVIFDKLVKHNILPENPDVKHFTDGKEEIKATHKTLKQTLLTPKAFWKVPVDGLRDSRMILRWIFFGIVLAALIRTFVSPDQFQTLFGPTLAGLGLTILVATILEVCSEGSTPIAADILTRANAPGNSFAFLMTGVATDYTEIMGLKETTKSWKIAFFLPLVTLPQVLILAWILNQGAF